MENKNAPQSTCNLTCFITCFCIIFNQNFAKIYRLLKLTDVRVDLRFRVNKVSCRYLQICQGRDISKYIRVNLKNLVVAETPEIIIHVILYIGPVKQKNQRKSMIIFLSINFSMCLGAQKNRLIETVLLSTHNICCG